MFMFCVCTEEPCETGLQSLERLSKKELRSVGCRALPQEVKGTRRTDDI